MICFLFKPVHPLETAKVLQSNLQSPPQCLTELDRLKSGQGFKHIGPRVAVDLLLCGAKGELLFTALLAGLCISNTKRLKF